MATLGLNACRDEDAGQPGEGDAPPGERLIAGTAGAGPDLPADAPPRESLATCAEADGVQTHTAAAAA